jgi:hypothetical protein
MSNRFYGVSTLAATDLDASNIANAKMQVRNECGTPIYAAVLLGIFLRVSICDCLITI